MNMSEETLTSAQTDQPDHLHPAPDHPESAMLGLGAFVLFVVFLSRIRAANERYRREERRRATAEARGVPMVAVAQLPPELKEPARAFTSQGIEYLTAAQLAQIYDECAKIAASRTRLYEEQAYLIKAQTAHDLAFAAAKFVATLNTEERALLQMRIEAQFRLDFDRLRAENAQLATEVAQYRNLLPDRR